MDILKNFAALIKVKTIVTLVVIAVFVVLALRGDIPADNVMVIVTCVVSFYFGTQHEKTVKNPVQYIPTDETVEDTKIEGFAGKE